MTKKILGQLARFWDWLVLSSADPQKVSLTVKGFLIAMIPILASLIPGFDAATLTSATEDIRLFIDQFLALVGTIMALIGLVRKIANTLKPMP